MPMCLEPMRYQVHSHLMAPFYWLQIMLFARSKFAWFTVCQQTRVGNSLGMFYLIPWGSCFISWKESLLHDGFVRKIDLNYSIPTPTQVLPTVAPTFSHSTMLTLSLPRHFSLLNRRGTHLPLHNPPPEFLLWIQFRHSYCNCRRDRQWDGRLLSLVHLLALLMFSPYINMCEVKPDDPESSSPALKSR